MDSLNEFREDFLSIFRVPNARLPDAGMHVECEGPVCRYVGEGSESHWYSLSLTAPVPESELAGIVQRERRVAEERGRHHEWKEFPLLHGAGLGAALAAAGYQIDRRCRLLFTSTESAVPASPGVRVEEVKSEGHFRALGEIGARVWGHRSEDLIQSLRDELALPAPLAAAYLAYVPGLEEPASGAWIKLYHRLGFLFGGSTLVEARKKGAYRALVAARMAFARKRGVRFVASECSPDSEAVLRVLRFSDAGPALRHILPR